MESVAGVGRASAVVNLLVRAADSDAARLGSRYN